MYRDEYSLKVVVAVGAFADDMQSEINLAVGVRYHMRG